MLMVFIFYVTGSAEEQIRNDLQAVAEGVAASVFQPSTTSNPESIDSIQDADVKKSSAEHKAKAEVIHIHFQLVICTSIVVIFPQFILINMFSFSFRMLSPKSLKERILVFL